MWIDGNGKISCLCCWLGHCLSCMHCLSTSFIIFWLHNNRRTDDDADDFVEKQNSSSLVCVTEIRVRITKKVDP